MEAVSKRQISTIYAMGAALGLVEHGDHSHEDNLHQLVAGLTGTDSVKALSADDASRVIRELQARMRGFQSGPQAAGRPAAKPAKRYTETPGGMTAGQQRKVWALMYELQGYDEQPKAASLGDRLAGIVKRQFGMDAAAREPMRFLNFDDGAQLIEILKKYVDSADRRKYRAGGGA